MEKLKIREMVHSLRNPLTAILSNLEILIGGYISELDKETVTVLKEIDFNAKYMEILLENASNVAKIEDNSDLMLIETDISRMIINNIKELKIIKEDAEKEILLERDEKIFFSCEPDMFRRFFMVILFELLKFTRSDIILKIKLFRKEFPLSIKIYYTQPEKKQLIDEEKVFTEFFINPSQRANMQGFEYFQKILKIFKGEAILVNENNKISLLINFK